MAAKEKSQIVMYSLLVILLIAAAAESYFINKQGKEFSQLQQELTSTKSQYESQMNTLNILIQNLEQETNTKIQKLSSTIKKTQQESEEKLSELEEDIKGISIEAGDFSAVVEDSLKGVVSIITDNGQGSGAIITEDGYIVTNYHVIEGASQLGVVTYNNKVYSASLIGKDELNDLAVLKMKTNNTFHELQFTNSDNVKIGEKVAALGNPAGLGFSVTQGIISQKDRIISGSVGLLQTDVPINPGNSGGPLINTNGKVIGILRAKVKGFEGLGFAIPSNYVVAKAQEITNTNI